MGDIQHIGDLKPDRRNPNKGTQRGRGMVEASLRELGAGRSIVVDKNGNVIAGNKTLEAWADIANADDVVVVKTRGDKLVVVQREDLDLVNDGKARRLSIADNRAGEIGLDWDAEILAAIKLDDDGALDGLFSSDELAEVLGDISGVEFPEYDESVEDEVEYITCPECGHRWPK
jgi:hypothetical protein